MGSSSDITDRFIDLPLEEGIILQRDEQGVATNVPHYVTQHSPAGFEFGYGGSGPADLALNIVEAVLKRIGGEGPRVNCYDSACFGLAYELHQEFKWKFVAPVPSEGAVLDYAKVEAWVRQGKPVVHEIPF